jgi:membrane-associated phospholipid phosphatase
MLEGQNAMKQKPLFLFLFIIIFEFPLCAQIKYTFSQFLNETGDFVKQPVKWDGIDYLKIGCVGLGTGLIMFADQPIRTLVLKDRSYYYSFPIESARTYGELYSPFVFFGGFAAYSLITGDMTSRKIAYEIGQACLYAGGLTFLLKTAIGRARPYMEKGTGTYRPFYSLLNQDYHSLPGGHSTTAFTISTILSRNVEPVWLKVLLYAPAVMTMVSRVYQDKHWTSDNFAGAALGYFVATWVVDKHEKAAVSDTKETHHALLDRIQVQPVLTGDSYGLNLSIPLL